MPSMKGLGPISYQGNAVPRPKKVQGFRAVYSELDQAPLFTRMHVQETKNLTFTFLAAGR